MKPPCKSPCRECPMRRKSLPGWLGAATPKRFIASVLADIEMPCHMTVDYEKPNWREEIEKTGRQCAGVAVFFANICKMSHAKDRARLPADPKNVFTMAEEFVLHHEAVERFKMNSKRVRAAAVVRKIKGRKADVLIPAWKPEMVRVSLPQGVKPNEFDCLAVEFNIGAEQKKDLAVKVEKILPRLSWEELTPQ